MIEPIEQDALLSGEQFEPSDDRVAQLRSRLADRAGERGLLDVAYRALDTELGALLLASTPVGLVSVTFDGDAPDATLERLATVLSPRILKAPARLDAAAHAIDDLIAGRARAFGGPLDLSLARGFGRDVIERLREIPYGETRTYGWIAARIGQPAAVRAVGLANSRNPLSIVVPCHRVVGSTGALTGYAGGVERKRFLLDHERRARLDSVA